MTETFCYDIETLANYTLIVFKNIKGGTPTLYEFSEQQNDTKTLTNWLKTSKHQLVGYNSAAFDDQIIEHIIRNQKDYTLMTGDNVASDIYRFVQEQIITETEDGRRQEPPYPRHRIKNKSIDLYKIWHYDNKARSTSLKHLMIAMREPLVLDMPIHHYQTVTPDQYPMIREYCINDVDATVRFYNHSTERITMRELLQQQYGTDLMTKSDSSIGEMIFVKELSTKIGEPYQTLLKGRTPRKVVEISKCIIPQIRFDTPEFQSALNHFNKLIIVEGEKNDEFFTLEHQNVTLGYGKGGLHGSIKPGIYESDDQYVIGDYDVASYYPSLCVAYNIRPKHFPKQFSQIFDTLKEMRAEHRKGSPLSNAFKLAGNSVFGRFGSEHSSVYDPAALIKVTVNGMLLLSMLIEALGDKVQLIQANTDGITIRHHRDNQQYVNDIMAAWMLETKMVLEHVEYSKMVIRDVNNYIAIKPSGEVKHKGTFEIERDWHKNPSQRIVAIALHEYYVNGADVEDVVRSHKDPYDFFIMSRFRSTDYGTWGGEKQQKTVRFFVSTTGPSFVKHYIMSKKDGSKVPSTANIVGGNKIMMVNDLRNESVDVSLIDYDYYIDEVFKVVTAIVPEVTRHGEQLTLC
jgi:hypothetical protein